MNQNTDRENIFLNAARRILRALVRLFVRQGISYTQLLELLKELYVKEVEQALVRNGERCTQSRISIISGVHRKDVKRLLEMDDGTTRPPKKVSITSRLLSVWSGDPAYTDDDGNPRPLPRTDENSGISFDQLVSNEISDVRPRAILDEWVQRELVEIDENGLIHLKLESTFPAKDMEEKLHYLGKNTSDHIAACDHNIHQTGPSYPERSVFFDGLSSDSVDKLQQSASNWAQKSLRALNAEALDLAKKDDETDNHCERFTFGVYFYREDESDETK